MYKLRANELLVENRLCNGDKLSKLWGVMLQEGMKVMKVFTKRDLVVIRVVLACHTRHRETMRRLGHDSLIRLDGVTIKRYITIDGTKVRALVKTRDGDVNSNESILLEQVGDQWIPRMVTLQNGDQRFELSVNEDGEVVLGKQTVRYQIEPEN